MKRLLLVPAGVVIAFVGTIAGIGGGLFAVPLLHYVRGLELRRSVGTSLVLVLATTATATIAELARAEPVLRAPLVGATASGVLVGAPLGFQLSRRIGARALKTVFALVLLAAAGRLLAGGGARGGEGAELDAAALAAGLAAGLGGGFVAPLLGVGGGLLMVPALFVAIPEVDFVEARATSLAAGAAAAVLSLALHARAGTVAAGPGLALGLGAVGGAAAGGLAVHVPGIGTAGRVLLALVLTATALRFARDALAAARAAPGS